MYSLYKGWFSSILTEHLKGMPNKSNSCCLEDRNYQRYIQKFICQSFWLIHQGSSDITQPSPVPAVQAAIEGAPGQGFTFQHHIPGA